MTKKVSSGAKKSGAPAYANRTAFRHNPASRLTKKILAMPITGLCPACHEQIEWRKRFRKYKPLTQPKKCVGCGGKDVKEAYHVICRGCAQKEGKCEKCRESRSLDRQKMAAMQKVGIIPGNPGKGTAGKEGETSEGLIADNEDGNSGDSLAEDLEDLDISDDEEENSLMDSESDEEDDSDSHVYDSEDDLDSDEEEEEEEEGSDNFDSDEEDDDEYDSDDYDSEDYDSEDFDSVDSEKDASEPESDATPEN